MDRKKVIILVVVLIAGIILYFVLFSSNAVPASPTGTAPLNSTDLSAEPGTPYTGPYQAPIIGIPVTRLASTPSTGAVVREMSGRPVVN